MAWIISDWCGVGGAVSWTLRSSDTIRTYYVIVVRESGVTVEEVYFSPATIWDAETITARRTVDDRDALHRDFRLYQTIWDNRPGELMLFDFLKHRISLTRWYRKIQPKSSPRNDKPHQLSLF